VLQGHLRMIKPSRQKIGNLKLNIAKNSGSGSKPNITFDILFDKYSKQKAVTSDRPLKRMRSPTHKGGSSSPPRVATRYKGKSSQHGQHFTPSRVPSSSNQPHPIYDDNGVMWGATSTSLSSWMGRTKISCGQDLQAYPRPIDSLPFWSVSSELTGQIGF
jgi:hypothetical protein